MNVGYEISEILINSQQMNWKELNSKIIEA